MLFMKYKEKNLKKLISRIRLEYYISNQQIRIAVENMTKILLKLTEEKGNKEYNRINIFLNSCKGIPERRARI